MTAATLSSSTRPLASTKSDRKNPHKGLSPKQKAFIRDLGNPDIEEMAEDGGARAGKSWGIIVGIINRALKYPGSRHLLARYRRAHLEKTLWMQTLIPILQITFPNGGYLEDKSKLIITFPNGSTIWGEGLDTKERVEKVMGSEYVTVFLNEGTQLIYNTYQSLLTRLSQTVYSEDGKVCPAKMIVDCNPRNKHHWIYKYFHLHIDPESRFSSPLPVETVRVMSQRKWTPNDNPYLSESYKKKLARLTGAAGRRLNKGDWVDQEGLVYPGYDVALCDPFEIPKKWICAGAVDFGYTNPFVFGWWALDESNETWYLFDERYERQQTVKVHCQAIKSHDYKPRWIVADHDSEDRATMAENGLPTIAAVKDVERGIQITRDLLYREESNGDDVQYLPPLGMKIRIFRTCVHTVEEIATYAWQESKDGKNDKEVPIKHLDHSMDMIRYFSMHIHRSSGWGALEYLKEQ